MQFNDLEVLKALIRPKAPVKELSPPAKPRILKVWNFLWLVLPSGNLT